MATATSLLRQYFSPLKDLPCWHVTAEYGSWLSLRFGEPHLEIREANPQAKAKALHRRAVFIEGNYLLWIEMGAWELWQDSKLAFHSDQSRAYLRRAAARLDGQKLIHIELSPKRTQTKFTFDLGSTLVVVPDKGAEADHPLWHMYGQSKFLSLLANGELQYGSASSSSPKRLKETGNVSYAA